MLTNAKGEILVGFRLPLHTNCTTALLATVSPQGVQESNLHTCRAIIRRAVPNRRSAFANVARAAGSGKGSTLDSATDEQFTRLLTDTFELHMAEMEAFVSYEASARSCIVDVAPAFQSPTTTSLFVLLAFDCSHLLPAASSLADLVPTIDRGRSSIRVEIDVPAEAALWVSSGRLVATAAGPTTVEGEATTSRRCLADLVHQGRHQRLGYASDKGATEFVSSVRHDRRRYSWQVGRPVDAADVGLVQCDGSPLFPDDTDDLMLLAPTPHLHQRLATALSAITTRKRLLQLAEDAGAPVDLASSSMWPTGAPLVYAVAPLPRDPLRVFAGVVVVDPTLLDFPLGATAPSLRLRHLLLMGAARQWFSLAVRPATDGDAWLTLGAAAFVARRTLARQTGTDAAVWSRCVGAREDGRESRRRLWQSPGTGGAVGDWAEAWLTFGDLAWAFTTTDSLIRSPTEHALAAPLVDRPSLYTAGFLDATSLERDVALRARCELAFASLVARLPDRPTLHRLLVSLHAAPTLSTLDFVRRFESLASVDVSPDAALLVYGRGLGALTASYVYRPRRNRLSLAVRMVNGGATEADETLRSFAGALTIPVKVAEHGGTSTVKLELAGASVLADVQCRVKAQLYLENRALATADDSHVVLGPHVLESQVHGVWRRPAGTTARRGGGSGSAAAAGDDEDGVLARAAQSAAARAAEHDPIARLRAISNRVNEVADGLRTALDAPMHAASDAERQLVEVALEMGAELAAAAADPTSAAAEGFLTSRLPSYAPENLTALHADAITALQHAQTLRGAGRGLSSASSASPTDVLLHLPFRYIALDPDGCLAGVDIQLTQPLACASSLLTEPTVGVRSAETAVRSVALATPTREGVRLLAAVAGDESLFLGVRLLAVAGLGRVASVSTDEDDTDPSQGAPVGAFGDPVALARQLALHQLLAIFAAFFRDSAGLSVGSGSVGSSRDSGNDGGSVRVLYLRAVLLRTVASVRSPQAGRSLTHPDAADAFVKAGSLIASAVADVPPLLAAAFADASASFVPPSRSYRRTILSLVRSLLTADSSSPSPRWAITTSALRGLAFLQARRVERPTPHLFLAYATNAALPTNVRIAGVRAYLTIIPQACASGSPPVSTINDVLDTLVSLMEIEPTAAPADAAVAAAVADGAATVFARSDPHVSLLEQPRASMDADARSLALRIMALVYAAIERADRRATRTLLAFATSVYGSGKLPPFSGRSTSLAPLPTRLPVASFSLYVAGLLPSIAQVVDASSREMLGLVRCSAASALTAAAADLSNPYHARRAIMNLLPGDGDTPALVAARLSEDEYLHDLIAVTKPTLVPGRAATVKVGIRLTARGVTYLQYGRLEENVPRVVGNELIARPDIWLPATRPSKGMSDERRRDTVRDHLERIADLRAEQADQTARLAYPMTTYVRAKLIHESQMVSDALDAEIDKLEAFRQQEELRLERAEADVARQREADAIAQVERERREAEERERLLYFTAAERSAADGVLRNLLGDPQIAAFFGTPLDDAIIKSPRYARLSNKRLDLGTINGRLQSGGYRTPSSFVEDVKACFEVGQAFYGPETEKGMIAARGAAMVARDVKAAWPSGPATEAQRTATVRQAQARSRGPPASGTTAGGDGNSRRLTVRLARRSRTEGGPVAAGASAGRERSGDSSSEDVLVGEGPTVVSQPTKRKRLTVKLSRPKEEEQSK